MTLEIIDSRYGEYKKIVCDIIMIILAKEYPLTIGEITKQLKNNFEVDISFQAVRKSLNNMVDRKILLVEDKKYFVNKNYILELKRITDQLLKNYFQGSKLGKVVVWSEKPESHSTYVFENFIKTDQFCNEIILDWAHNLKEGEDNRFFFQSPHFWYIFVQLGIESSFLKEIKALKVKAYYLCDGKTLLDRWTKKFYDAHNIKYMINTFSTSMKTTIAVFGDFVVQYDYSASIYEKIEEFYKVAKDIDTTNLAKIAQLSEFPTNISLIVMKN